MSRQLIPTEKTDRDSSAITETAEKGKPCLFKVATSAGWELTIPVKPRYTRKAVFYVVNGKRVRADEAAELLTSAADSQFAELKELIVGVLRLQAMTEDGLPNAWGPLFGHHDN